MFKVIQKCGLLALFFLVSAGATAYTPTEMVVFGASQSNNLPVDNVGLYPDGYSELDDVSGTKYPYPLADRLGINGRNYALGGANSIHMLGAVNGYLADVTENGTVTPDFSGTVFIIAPTLSLGNPEVDRDNKVQAIALLTNAGAQHIFLADHSFGGNMAWFFYRWSINESGWQTTYPQFEDFVDAVDAVVIAGGTLL